MLKSNTNYKIIKNNISSQNKIELEKLQNESQYFLFTNTLLAKGNIQHHTRIPLYYLFSSVFSQVSPPKPPSYSIGALPDIDTQGSYNSIIRYNISNFLSVDRSIIFTIHNFEVSFVL